MYLKANPYGQQIPHQTAIGHGENSLISGNWLMDRPLITSITGNGASSFFL